MMNFHDYRNNKDYLCATDYVDKLLQLVFDIAVPWLTSISNLIGILQIWDTGIHMKHEFKR